MIVDVSAPEQVDRLRQAALRFGRGDQVEALVEAPAALAFVALETSNEVIGWCLGHRLVRPDGASMLYMHELEVAEEHRRQGHGRALLEAFMAAGESAGATKMFLSAAEANRPARRLYESIGVISRPRDRPSTTGLCSAEATPVRSWRRICGRPSAPWRAPRAVLDDRTTSHRRGLRCVAAVATTVLYRGGSARVRA